MALLATTLHTEDEAGSKNNRQVDSQRTHAILSSALSLYLRAVVVVRFGRGQTGCHKGKKEERGVGVDKLQQSVLCVQEGVHQW